MSTTDAHTSEDQVSNLEDVPSEEDDVSGDDMDDAPHEDLAVDLQEGVRAGTDLETEEDVALDMDNDLDEDFAGGEDAEDEGESEDSDFDVDSGSDSQDDVLDKPDFFA